MTTKPVEMIPDSAVHACPFCEKPFSFFFRRVCVLFFASSFSSGLLISLWHALWIRCFPFCCSQHHCRQCGKVVCAGCSSHHRIAQKHEYQRICDSCFVCNLASIAEQVAQVETGTPFTSTHRSIPSSSLLQTLCVPPFVFRCGFFFCHSSCRCRLCRIVVFLLFFCRGQRALQHTFTLSILRRHRTARQDTDGIDPCSLSFVRKLTLQAVSEWKSCLAHCFFSCFSSSVIFSFLLPSGYHLLPASVIERHDNGCVYLRCSCPRHGTRVTLTCSKAAWLKKMMSITTVTPPAASKSNNSPGEHDRENDEEEQGTRLDRIESNADLR